MITNIPAWLPLFNLIVLFGIGIAIVVVVVFQFKVTSDMAYTRGRVAEWELWRNGHEETAKKAMVMIFENLEAITILLKEMQSTAVCRHPNGVHRDEA